MAGVWGEDRNRNGQLDDGEDMNANGLLEADWSLADKSESSNISFNTRADLRDADGVLIATGVYETKTRYFIEDGTVFREKTRFNDAGVAHVVRTPLATRVKELTFARSGGLIRIRATVQIVRAGGRARDEVLETRVWLRN